MRAIAVVSLAFVLLFSPMVVLAQGSTVPEPQFLETTAGEDFTHLPIAELLTGTGCVYCPDAEAKLDDIFHHDGYPWYYVALVTNENDEASGRASELEGPTWGTPTTEFDGGFETVSGGSAARSEYTQAIEDSGTRDDTEVFLNLSMIPVANDPNRAILTFTAIFQEDGDPPLNPNLDAHIYVYIMERTSTRYKNEYSEKWVHHGFLSFAFDEDVALEPHTEFTRTVEWVGADHSDDHGDMSDVVYDNLLAMAVVLNDESSETDSWALEGAGAIPPDLEILSPETNTTRYGKVTLEAAATANHTTLQGLDYRVDGGEWVPMDQVEDDRFSVEWDSSNVENGERLIEIRAMDDTGTQSWQNLSLNIDNDEHPPELSWVAPSAGTLTGIVEVEVTASDAQGVEKVEIRVDDGPFQSMTEANNDTFVWDWNTATAADGEHTLVVRATDVIGNEGSIERTFEVNNGGEATIPAVTLLEPESDGSWLSEMVKLKVHATDPEGIDKVTYTFTGSDKDHTLSSAGDDEFTANWNTEKADNGEVTVIVTAVDNDGSENSATETYMVDNERPTLDVTMPYLEDGQALARQLIMAEASDKQTEVTVEYSVNGEGWIEMGSTETDKYEANWNTLALEDGNHLVQVRAIDEAGNDILWTGSPEVVNEEIVFSYVSDASPDSDDEMELTIPLGRQYESVTILFTKPSGLAPMTAEWTGSGYVVTMPTDFDEDTEVEYHLELDTGHGKILGPTETYSVNFAGRTGGGDSSDDDLDLTLILGVTGALVLVGAGGFFYLYQQQGQQEQEDEWGMGPGMVAPTEAAPQAPAGPAATAPVAAAVSCPHCFQHVTPPPGERPLVVACPFCTGQFQIE